MGRINQLNRRSLQTSVRFLLRYDRATFATILLIILFNDAILPQFSERILNLFLVYISTIGFSIILSSYPRMDWFAERDIIEQPIAIMISMMRSCTICFSVYLVQNSLLLLSLFLMISPRVRKKTSNLFHGFHYESGIFSYTQRISPYVHVLFDVPMLIIIFEYHSLWFSVIGLLFLLYWSSWVAITEEYGENLLKIMCQDWQSTVETYQLPPLPVVF